MRRAVATILLGLLLAGCGGTAPGPAAAPPRPEQVDEQIVAASDEFGVNLLRAVHSADSGTNIFLSPTSAAVILSLTANGARGDTQAEMLSTLGYGALDLEAVNEANQALRGLLADPDPKVELSMANAVWYRKGMEVAPEFEAVARDKYGAQVEEAAFGDPKAVAAINRWVSKETRERIPQLLERTDPSDAMILVNALYFKGEWQKPFQAAATHEQPFHLAGGGTKLVPFMHQEDAFGYLRAEGITGVRLPYGEGGLALYAFMPDDWEGFVEGLTPERYRELIDGMSEERVRLAIPKVKLEYHAELADPLSALGMRRAFTPGEADLSGLFVGGEEYYISRVVQKTYLEINEKGTEAAAATAVVVAEGAASIEQPPAVVLDHPFLVAVRDDRTGVTLFMGTILEP